MTKVWCPKCKDAPAQFLEALSEFAYVNYYRCERCAYVWNVPKSNPDATPRDVLPPATTVNRKGD